MKNGIFVDTFTNGQVQIGAGDFTFFVKSGYLIEDGKLNPELIIGVPVGFVNVVQSKELIMHTDVPYIVARGRKGGSNIAACICNALLYMIDNNRG